MYIYFVCHYYLSLSASLLVLLTASFYIIFWFRLLILSHIDTLYSLSWDSENRTAQSHSTLDVSACHALSHENHLRRNLLEMWHCYDLSQYKLFDTLFSLLHYTRLITNKQRNWFGDLNRNSHFMNTHIHTHRTTYQTAHTRKTITTITDLVSLSNSNPESTHKGPLFIWNPILLHSSHRS